MIAYGDYKMTFKNEHVIYEHVVKCEVKDHEFNYSYNPSLLSIISGSRNTSGIIESFANENYFSPYATSIGLYNDSNELLAIAKFSSPIPLSGKTDSNFFVKWDL